MPVVLHPLPTLGPITRKKLVLVKQLYQEALVQSSRSGIASRMLSVIHFDLANETTLRTVITALDSSNELAKKLDDMGFTHLVNKADKVLSSNKLKPVPKTDTIQRVHFIRNAAQHEARYPNESEVSDCRTYTRDFLKQIIFNVWGLELEKISLTELVQNRQIKKYLVDAETALGKGNLVDAVEYASAGLQVAMNHAGEAIVWHKPRFTGQHYDDEYLEDTLDRMKDVLSLAVLGLNYGDFMRYKRIVGAVFVRSDGSFQHPDMKEEITARDAEFVVTYCIDTVVQIENAVGNLDVLAEPDGRGA